MTGTVHPIETESYRILAGRVDLSALGPGAAAVVARVVHASADVEYATSMVLDEAAVASGVAALRAGAPVITDVAMVAAGLPGLATTCYLPSRSGGRSGLDQAAADENLTRSAAGMRTAAARHPEGAVVVVGCAPTALAEVVRLWAGGAFRPALVVGLPVGFVGAAEAKAALRATGMRSISNVGEKGGSAVAAAAVNALARLAGVVRT